MFFSRLLMLVGMVSLLGPSARFGFGLLGSVMPSVIVAYSSREWCLLLYSVRQSLLLSRRLRVGRGLGFQFLLPLLWIL